ncbi:trimeric intracellular cation channel family protein [uncultured Dokdonia sp.]|uniref:trimeric intracellular cation channel family protein n=1 Tax=uncultured Dokdonia sp. TaxID=575653 RepID=UPI0026140612|nr:trimeric intracellular cation channel family protein [uncultured Dokdonia sp.]
MDVITLIDILGTIAFAISGVLTAMNKRMDAFGILIIALITSIGGGTLRDVLIGKTPVTWMQDQIFPTVIFITAVFAVVFRSKLKYFRRSLFLFDTIGIGLYTITGVQVSLAFGLDPLICVILGTVSACFGGVLRDILCNEIPIIFHKEIYATACIVGAVIYLLLIQFEFSQTIAMIISGSVIISIRILAVVFKWKLPRLYKKEIPSS